MDKAKFIELLNVWGESFRSAHTTVPQHVGGMTVRAAYEQNLGTVDRMIRAVLGLAALVLLGGGLVDESVAFAVVAVAIVLLLTSLWGLCPLYVPFGISTAPKPQSGHAAAIGRLCANRRRPVPLSESTLDNVAEFAESPESCAAVAPAERECFGMYDEFPPKTLPRDIQVVLEAQSAASFDRHLPTFEAHDGGRP